MLFDRRQVQACPMDVQRHPVGPLEDLQVFERDHLAAALFLHLSSVVCLLSSESHSFGTWLEPRYIVGAKTLD